MKKFTFEGILSGDGECFCFKVDKETWIRINGQQDYDYEIAYQKAACAEIGQEYVEPTHMLLYPGDIFYYNDGEGDQHNKVRVSVEVDSI